MSSPQSILVIRPNRLGDMICTLPLIHALKQKYPSTRISVLTEVGGYLIAKHCQSVNDVFLMRKGITRWDRPLWNRQAFSEADVVIVAKGGFDRSLAWLAACSRSPMRIGFSNKSANSCYTHPLPLPPYEHQVETLLRLIEPLNITNAPLNFSISLPQQSWKIADTLLGSSDPKTPLAIINPWCNRGIYWPLERLAQLSLRLAQNKWRVMILQSPDNDCARQIITQSAHPMVQELKSPDILTLAALLSKAQLFWTPEGGLAHLASISNTPTFIVWRPDGVIKKWRSRGERHIDFIPSQGLESVTVDEMIGQLLA